MAVKVLRDRAVASVLMFLLVLAVGQTSAQDEGVLAPGEPPLTETMVERLSGFVEWLLDVPLTQQQRDLISQSLREAWGKQNAEEVAGYLETLELEAQVAQMNPEERVLLREQALPPVLADLRNQPDDEGARWLLGIYDAGHQPIAQGNPPLTRQMTDAFVELLCFMLSEAVGEKLEAPAELRDEMASSLAAGYPGLPPDQQAEFARLPLIWAAYGVAWPGLGDEEKAEYRAEWQESFKPYLANIRAAAEAKEKEQAKANAGNAEPQEQDGAAALRKIQQNAAALQAQNQYFQVMSNVMKMQSDTTRIMISNMGNSYTYQYRY